MVLVWNGMKFCLHLHVLKGRKEREECEKIN